MIWFWLLISHLDLVLAMMQNRVLKEAEANKVKLTPEFLELKFIEAISNNTKMFFGEKVWHSIRNLWLLHMFPSICHLAVCTMWQLLSCKCHMEMMWLLHKFGKMSLCLWKSTFLVLLLLSHVTIEVAEGPTFRWLWYRAFNPALNYLYLLKSIQFSGSS